MIRSFADAATEDVFHGRATSRVRRLPAVVLSRTRVKLDILHVATELRDLAAPPANRLERLRGDDAGSWTIRVNDQWRLVFAWRDGHAYDVRLVDYHR